MTINKLPEEVLYRVFKNLTVYELLECQVVCRHWYIPAHAAFLGNLRFYHMFQIECFLYFMDDEFEKQFYGAVETIYFDKGAVADREQIDKSIINELFLRFPNLKAIYLTNNFRMLTALSFYGDELAEKCPKIAFVQFDQPDSTPYHNLLYKLRRSIEHIHFDNEMVEFQGCESMEEYQSRFPKVKKSDYLGIYCQQVIPLELSRHYLYQPLTLEEMKEDVMFHSRLSVTDVYEWCIKMLMYPFYIFLLYKYLCDLVIHFMDLSSRTREAVVDLPTYRWSNQYIEELTLHSNSYQVEAQVVKDCVTLFPNIKRLHTYFFYAVDKRYHVDFDFTGWNLEKLTLDLSPAFYQMGENLLHLRIDVHVGDRVHMYRLTPEFKLLPNPTDRKVLYVNFVVVKVRATSLESLECFACQKGDYRDRDYQKSWGSDKMKHITLF